MAETKGAAPVRPTVENDPAVVAAKEAAVAAEVKAKADHDESLRKMEARKEQEGEKDGREGLWVRYVNPNAGLPDADPPFESMDGYTFEANGDFVMVKAPYDRLEKFRNNKNFEVEEVDDASKVEDGDTKAAPKGKSPAVQRKVGKNRR